MARAKQGRVGSPPKPPTAGPPAGAPASPGASGKKPNVLEVAFERGKLGPQDNAFSRVLQRAKDAVRETFIPQHELVGNDELVKGKTRTRFFAAAKNTIRKLHSQVRNVREENQKVLKSLWKNLTPEEYKDASYYVFLRDAHENILRGTEHRPGFTATEIADEINRMAQKVQNNPDLQIALDSRQKLMHGVRDMLQQEGFYMGDVPREWFMHHDLVDFIDTDVKRKPPASGGLRAREVGSVKKREGSARDIKTDLIDVDERYLTETMTMLEKVKELRKVSEMYDIRNNPKEGFKIGQQGQPPKGYVTRDITSGFSRLHTGSIAERYLAETIDFGGLDKLAKHYGFTPKEFQQALTQIGITDPESLARKLGTGELIPTKESNKYIIPEELARTMDNAVDQLNKKELRGVSEHLVRFWKTLVLNLAPVRYNFRNLTGDVQRMYVQFGNEAFDPALWRKAVQSTVDRYKNDRVDPLGQIMLKEAVSSSGRTLSETSLATIDPHLRNLEHGLQTGDLKQMTSKVWEFMRKIPELSAMREDIVRGVITEMNIRRMERGESPLTGVADKEMVKGLLDVGDKEGAIGYISRKSLVDYGDLTPRENKWRNGWMPFYAWASRNFQFWANLPKQMKDAGGRDQLARQSGMATLKGAAVTATILSSIRLWNELVMGEYEENLPENIRKTSHFIIPDIEHYNRTKEFKPLFDKNGKVTVWQTADALDDFMTMLGIDKLAPEAFAVNRGTLTKDEMAKRQREHMGWSPGGAFIPGKAPARALLNQTGPMGQALTQTVAGKRMFPDPFNASTIQPEQSMSALRDVLGLSALPGVEGAFDFLNPGADVFQPTVKTHDIPGQLGIKHVQEPNIFMRGQMQTGGLPKVTVYEADLIKRLEQTESELNELGGRMMREKSERSNRQLEPEVRDENFMKRQLRLQELVGTMKDLGERLKTLRRTRRYNDSNPRP